jgi:hypothetical protein
MFSRDSKQDLEHPIGIGAVGNTHGDVNPPEPIEKGPVDNPRPDKLAVGNDDIGPVRCAQHAGPKADFADFSKNSSNLDKIPYLHRMLKYKDETRDKIIHYTLQTKSYADAEGADQECHLAEIDTGRG